MPRTLPFPNPSARHLLVIAPAQLPPVEGADVRLSALVDTLGAYVQDALNSTKDNSRTKQYSNIACKPNRLDFKRRSL